MDLRDERELALQRLRVLCHSGLFSIVDFRYNMDLSYKYLPWQTHNPTHRTMYFLCTVACRHNPLNIFAAHEIAGFCDPSVATKMTVQFNLFGGRFCVQPHIHTALRICHCANAAAI